MFQSIISKMNRDLDFPLRTFMLEVYKRVLKGKIYDHLKASFNEERDSGGAYIPLIKRRPSVRARLAKVVVNDSVSLLFDDKHFPTIESDEEEFRQTLQNIVNHCKVNLLMIQAATKGSIGSVAIAVRVLDNRLFFDAMWTQYLTPFYKRNEPDKLLKVIEKYKVRGNDLIASGYQVEDKDAVYWIIREWNEIDEVRYKPYIVGADEDPKFELTLDAERTTAHNLGFVPVIWIKNLPFECDFEDDNDIDGECTFQAANEAIVEIDYQLSQLGRGLRYTSDPTLLIKEPAAGQNQAAIPKGAANALVVDKDGDAKYLEISGAASAAVIEYVETLRKIALENIHGNRSDADKIAAAQSGRAIELMHQSLVWLAGTLRITYGDGLLNLLKMIVKITEKYKIIINDQEIEKLDQTAVISLRWPAWFSPTESDKQATASTLTTLKDGGIISQETAVKTIASDYDIEDVPEEIKQIQDDLKKFNEAMKPAVTENFKI